MALDFGSDGPQFGRLVDDVDVLVVDVASVEVLLVVCHVVPSLASGAKEILQQRATFVGE